ncbi:hypothetical protein J6590_106032, partial [Homalodisca vitripennis]
AEDEDVEGADVGGEILEEFRPPERVRMLLETEVSFILPRPGEIRLEPEGLFQKHPLQGRVPAYMFPVNVYRGSRCREGKSWVQPGNPHVGNSLACSAPWLAPYGVCRYGGNGSKRQRNQLYRGE